MPIFRPRRSVSIGGVRLNLGKRGITSASVRRGRVTRNLATGRTSVRTPLGSLIFGGGGKRRSR
jgi:hypothetical protein